MSMLILHSRPTDTAVAIGGSTGGALATAADTLFNNMPDSLTRFVWPSGAQTTSTVLRIQMTWGTGLSPRGWALLNTTLPVGTKIVASLKRPADSGFPYNPTTGDTQRVVELPRGERIAMGAFPSGMDDCIGLELAIFNDVNGVASITASSAQDIGEVYFGAGTDMDLKIDYSIVSIDPSGDDRTQSSQIAVDAEPPYRQLTFTPCIRRESEVFGDSASLSSEDFEELWAKLDRDQFAVFIPKWQDSVGAYSAQLLHRTAVFGRAKKMPGAKHLALGWYEHAEVTVEECPIPT